MSEETIAILTLLFSTPPIAFNSWKTIREIGIGVWLFSPMPIFWVSYVVAFVIRPILDAQIGLRYPATQYDADNFLYIQILATLSCWTFVLGYSLVKGRATRLKMEQSEELPPTMTAIAAQRAAFLIGGLFLTLMIVVLLEFNALTLNFADNRHNYGIAQTSGGIVTLTVGIASLFLFMGIMMMRWTNRLGKLGWAVSLGYLAVNVLVTNRSFVGTELLLFVFIYFLVQNRQKRKISPLKYLLAFGGVVSIGVGLTFVRNIGAEAQDDPNRPQLNAAIAPIAYMAVTFDMSELFQETVKKTDHFELGSSWIEDIFYTYLPRSVFPDKPVKYGVFRVQDEVVPSLTPESGLFTSSYPIGAWGEAYINFGPVGVLVTLFGLGALLKFLYTRSLELVYDRRVNWPSIVFMIQYAVLGLNPTGYMRSIGQYMFGLLYLNVVLWGSLRLVLAMANVLEALSPTKPPLTPPSEATTPV